MTPISPTTLTPTRLAVAISTAILMGATATSTAMASSHGEAPYIKARPKLDGSDFYAFNSYEPGREAYVSLIANYQPLQDAYGGPNYFSMDSQAIYEIHIDNDGDAVEDLSFLFNFDDSLNNGGEGLALRIGDQDVPVALKHIGALGNRSNQGVLNVNETYYVGTTVGERRSQSPVWAVRPDSGLRLFTKPYDHAGDKSFPMGYDNFVKSTTNSGEIYYDVEFDQCPDGARAGRVFAGQRKDSFSIALGEVFDLVNFVPLQGGVPDTLARDDLGDKNVTTLAIEVHKDCLTGQGNGVIGAWTTSSLRSDASLRDEPTFLSAEKRSGNYQQVSRLGSPLVNELVIGLPDKNAFNASEPMNDGQFATYVTNPTLPAILDILFRDAVGSPSDIAPSNLPRTDLVSAFLTGFAGVNQMSTVTASEMLRLNTGIPATAKDDQVNLGVAGGDLAGFPNGRRPGDDVTDIALRVVMGALCHPIAVDLDASGTAGDAGDNLGLCTPDQAPVGNAPFTDGVTQSAAQFDNAFPYLTTPISGSPNPASVAVDPMDDVTDGGDTNSGMNDDMDGGMEDVTDGGMNDDMDGGMEDVTDGGDMGGNMNGDCPVDPFQLSGMPVSGTEIELLWDAAPDGAGAEFTYDVFLDGGLFQTTDMPSIVVDGLDPATAYELGVVPVGADGQRIECVEPVQVMTAG